MKITVRKIWNTVTWIIVAAAVLLAVLLAGVRIMGLRVYTVLSGSMEPTYHVGSLIYVRNVNYKKLEAGDVITYMAGEDVIVTHRIVEVIPDPEDPETIRFQTKGDANDSADATPIHYKNIIGSPLFTIPYLGYLSDYIQRPPGTYAAISAGAVLMLLVFLPDLFTADGKKKKKAEVKEDG